MFLSKEAIAKQLVHEFLNFNTLALAPGKPIDLNSGTLLYASLKEDLGLAIECAGARLSTYLIPTLASEEQQRFIELLNLLLDYKKASHTKENPFAVHAQTPITHPYPCAWPIFAPLLIESPTGALAYTTQNDLLEHLQSSKTAFYFNKECTLEETGLYLAVKTNNHEMVAAFLCPQFYNYQLNKTDFKKLLSLTHDTKTRMTLFRHSKELIEWIVTDADLQKECILNSTELTELWLILNSEQRKQFINHTTTSLWLNLLDTPLSKQQIIHLLDDNFALLHTKLLKDKTIKKPDYLIKSLSLISAKEQLHYFINQAKDNSLIQTQSANWYSVLNALGYHLNKKGALLVTRYLLPEPIKTVHHQLIN